MTPRAMKKSSRKSRSGVPYEAWLTSDEVRAEIRDEAQCALDVFLSDPALPESLRGRIESRLDYGETAQVIARAPRDTEADLAVFGTHGKSGFAHAWLAGVDETENYEFAIARCQTTPRSSKTRKRDRDRAEALRLAGGRRPTLRERAVALARERGEVRTGDLAAIGIPPLLSFPHVRRGAAGEGGLWAVSCRGTDRRDLDHGFLTMPLTNGGPSELSHRTCAGRGWGLPRAVVICQTKRVQT